MVRIALGLCEHTQGRLRVGGDGSAIGTSRECRASFLLSGISVIVASASKKTLAIETAFSRATLTTLVGSMMPCNEVDVPIARRVKAVVFLPFQHSGNHDTTVHGRILSDLSTRSSERPLQNLVPVRSSPSAAVSSLPTASRHRSRANPPPGTVLKSQCPRRGPRAQ